MPGLYLALILFFTGCLMLCDWRWKLVLWKNLVPSLIVIAFAWVLLLIWDLFGIAFGAFAQGSGPWFIGVDVAPELPLEELFFLAFLCYLTLLLYSAFAKIMHRIDRDRAGQEEA